MYQKLDEKEIGRVGMPLQAFYIYLDRKGQHSDRKVITFWDVGMAVGGLQGIFTIIGSAVFLFLGFPSQHLKDVKTKGSML